MRDVEWVVSGPHRFVDCWCGHREPNLLDGATLDVDVDRVHRWITFGCDPACALQRRVHGHVHIHCPLCARTKTADSCCTPKGMNKVAR